MATIDQIVLNRYADLDGFTEQDAKALEDYFWYDAAHKTEQVWQSLSDGVFDSSDNLTALGKGDRQLLLDLGAKPQIERVNYLWRGALAHPTRMTVPLREIGRYPEGNNLIVSKATQVFADRSHQDLIVALLGALFPILSPGVLSNNPSLEPQLIAIFKDKDYPNATRLQAIEGLKRLGIDLGRHAEVLKGIAYDESGDLSLRLAVLGHLSSIDSEQPTVKKALVRIAGNEMFPDQAREQALKTLSRLILADKTLTPLLAKIILDRDASPSLVQTARSLLERVNPEQAKITGLLLQTSPARETLRPAAEAGPRPASNPNVGRLVSQSH